MVYLRRLLELEPVNILEFDLHLLEVFCVKLGRCEVHLVVLILVQLLLDLLRQRQFLFLPHRLLLLLGLVPSLFHDLDCISLKQVDL